MLESDEKVWVYLNSENTWKQFVDMAVAEGFHFGDLPVEKWAFVHVVAIHSNGNMGHLSLFVWCWSFSADVENCPRKVDFLRFINNHDDWFCETPHFTSIIR